LRCSHRALLACHGHPPVQLLLGCAG
jgi:hypothetical protein